jgi:membrane associated rhomboid family serine protease
VALVAFNVATFAYEASLGDTSARDAFVDAAAVIPYDLTHGVQIPGALPTVTTLVTAQFLHASVAHVAINMLFLVAFGPAIERSVGTLRFLAFYLTCGVLGNLAQISVDPASHVPEIGASGAIAGVLGAYIVRFPSEPLFLRVPAFVVIGLWAAGQFVHGFGTVSANVLSERGGGTAYFAHIGGFLAGVLSIALFTRTRGQRRAAHIGEL